MTVPPQHGPPVGSRGARAAWVWAGLTPLGWLVGAIPLALIGLAEGYANQPAGPGLWLLLEVLWLTAPTVAVISAIRAVRARSRSSGFALWVAGLLLLAPMAIFVIAAVNGHAENRIAVLTGLAVVAAAVGLFGWFPRSNPLPPGWRMG